MSKLTGCIRNDTLKPAEANNCHNRKLWLRQQSSSFPTAKTRAVGEETLSQQENSAVGKEIFANSSKSKD
jgi:hypothetical protein